MRGDTATLQQRRPVLAGCRPRGFGEVLWSGAYAALMLLAALGGVAQAEAPSPPAPTARATAALPSAAVVAAEPFFHDVVRGDTLFDIAAALLIDPAQWTELRRFNQIDKPRRLRPGTRLKLPPELVHQREMQARVAFVQGRVSAQGTDGGTRSLALGDTVRNGESLRTEPESTLTLALHDGSRIMVWASSQVRIERLLLIGRAAIPVVQLRVQHGDAEMRVAPAAPLRRFDVETPAVNLGVRGTEFRTRVDAVGATRLEVLQGSVTGQSGQQVLQVDAGLGLLAAPGEPLPLPLPLPPAPALDGVATLLEAVPLRMNWLPQPGAMGYRVQVAAEAAGGPEATVVWFDADVKDPALRLSDLPDGRYRLRVRLVGALGLQGIQSERVFVLKARPEPPFTRTPEPAARLHGARVDFTWARTAATSSYRLQVADSAGFDAGLRLDQAALSDTAFGAVLEPGDYRWRVRAVATGPDGQDDPGPWGEAQAFSLRPMPQSPALQPPSFDAAGLLLRWRAPLPGEQVQVQIARDERFTELLLEQTGAIDSVRLLDPEPGTLVLRIRSLDADGFAGPWGAPQHIEVPRSKLWFGLPLLLLLLFAL